jgi:hypothetical protein
MPTGLDTSQLLHGTHRPLDRPAEPVPINLPGTTDELLTWLVEVRPKPELSIHEMDEQRHLLRYAYDMGAWELIQGLQRIRSQQQEQIDHGPKHPRTAQTRAAAAAG